MVVEYEGGRSHQYTVVLAAQCFVARVGRFCFAVAVVVVVVVVVVAVLVLSPGVRYNKVTLSRSFCRETIIAHEPKHAYIALLFILSIFRPDSVAHARECEASCAVGVLGFLGEVWVG